MTRSLVTGATGFVGANLARALVNAGHEVHLAVRPRTDRWRLEGLAPPAHIHEADLANRSDVRDVVRAVHPDLVFHLAAFGAYEEQADFDQMIATNISGTANLLDASVDAGVAAFVQAGTSSEYGFKRAPARETDVLEPNSHYAITKSAATHYCQHLARTRDFAAITLRLYAIYGPWEEPSRLVPRLLTHGLVGEWPALVSPSTARDFVYVDDAVDAFISAASAAATLPRGAIYNVCSGTQVTLAEVTGEVRRLMAIEKQPAWSTMAPRVWDTDCWVGSPELIQRDLGWYAKTSLRAGLETTLAWLSDDDGRRARYTQDVPALIAPKRPQ